MKNEKITGNRSITSASLFKFTKNFPVFVLLLTLSFGVVTPAFSQITLGKSDNQKVQIAGELAANIPYVGPYLSFATQHLFGGVADKTDKELQAMWEAYTDKKVAWYKVQDRTAKITGYKAIFKDIDDLEGIGEREDIASENIIKKKIEKWKVLDEHSELSFPLFKSYPGEPARPLLPLLAAVAEMRLVSMDRQIILNLELAKIKKAQSIDDQVKNFDDEAKILKEQRLLMIERYNKVIDVEIQKAANERAELIVFNVFGEPDKIHEFAYYFAYDSGSVNKKGEVSGRTVSVVHRGKYMQERYENRLHVTRNNCTYLQHHASGNLVAPQGCIYGINKKNAEAEVRKVIANKKHQVRVNETNRARATYLLRDKMLLKVKTQVTIGFSLFDYFGAPNWKAGLIYWNVSKLREKRRLRIVMQSDDDRIWETRYGRDFWRYTYYGYVQGDSYLARDLLGKQKKGRSMVIKTKGGLQLQLSDITEEKYLDPFNDDPNTGHIDPITGIRVIWQTTEYWWYKKNSAGVMVEH